MIEKYEYRQITLFFPEQIKISDYFFKKFQYIFYFFI